MLRNSKKRIFIFLQKRCIPFTMLLLAGLLFSSSPLMAEYWYDPSEAYTPPTSNGTTYYVDGTNGSDSYTGLSPTYTSGTTGPWKTFAKAFYRYYNPGVGARILILGGKYYERFQIPDSWTYGNTESDRTIVAAYNNTEVIIDGSVTNNFGAWSLYSGSIYKSTVVTPFTSNGVTAVVIDKNFKTYRSVANVASITQDGHWFYDTPNNTIYVRTPASTGDPTRHDVVIVQDDGDSSARYIVDVSAGTKNTTISGLTIRGGSSHGVFVYNNQDKINIEKCRTMFNAKSGIYYNGTTNGVYSKNLVYGNVMRNWPRGMWNPTCAYINSGGWSGALGGAGASNMTFRGNIVYDNGGEGIISYVGTGGHLWENNIVYNNWSVNIYTDQQPGSVIRNNFIYSTGIDSAQMRDGCAAGADTQRILRRMRPEGIMTADEKYGGTYDSAHFTGAKIYNNIIVGCRRGITHYAWATGSGLKNTIVANNTIIVPNFDPSTVGDSYSGISYGYNGGNNSGSVVKNNIIYGVHPSTNLILWENTGESTDTGIAWNNNIYYHSGSSKPLMYKGTSYNFSNWKTQTGQDNNSKNENPMMKGASFVYP